MDLADHHMGTGLAIPFSGRLVLVWIITHQENILGWMQTSETEKNCRESKENKRVATVCVNWRENKWRGPKVGVEDVEGCKDVIAWWENTIAIGRIIRM